MKTTFGLGILGSVLLASSLASAAGLKPAQKEAKKAFEEEIKSYLDDAEKACGVKFKLKTNFEALKTSEWENTSISSYCAGAVGAVTTVCGKEAYKEALAAAVKEIHCLFGGKPGDNDAGTQANMSLKGKAFIYKMAPGNPNLVEPATLNDIDRRVLKECFRVMRRLQQRMELDYQR